MSCHATFARRRHSTRRRRRMRRRACRFEPATAATAGRRNTAGPRSNDAGDPCRVPDLKERDAETHVQRPTGVGRICGRRVGVTVLLMSFRRSRSSSPHGDERQPHSSCALAPIVPASDRREALGHQTLRTLRKLVDSPSARGWPLIAGESELREEPSGPRPLAGAPRRLSREPFRPGGPRDARPRSLRPQSAAGPCAVQRRRCAASTQSA